HRAVRPPAKPLRDLEPVAVERTQLDDAEAIELGEVLDALGIAERVLGRHRLERPLAEAADGEQEQAPVGNDGSLLLDAELARQPSSLLTRIDCGSGSTAAVLMHHSLPATALPGSSVGPAVVTISFMIVRPDIGSICVARGSMTASRLTPLPVPTPR